MKMLFATICVLVHASLSAIDPGAAAVCRHCTGSWQGAGESEDVINHQTESPQ